MAKLDDEYNAAKQKGKGKAFLANHPKYAQSLGKESADTSDGDTATDDGSLADPSSSADPVKVKAAVDDISKSAVDYGDTFAKDISDKYLKDAFGKIDANTSPEMAELLGRMNEWSKTSGNMTDYEKRALSEMESGLKGYDAPEVQAMREQASQEINRQYMTAMQQQAIQQARSGVRGAAAGAQAQDLGVGRVQASGNLERDLVVKNAEEIQNRRQAFANTVRSTEDARFGRESTANSVYGGALSGEEAARSSRQQFNVNQDTNAGLAKSGLATTGAGLYTGLYGSKSADQIGQSQFDALLKQSQATQKWMEEEAERNRQDNARSEKRYYGAFGS